MSILSDKLKIMTQLLKLSKIHLHLQTGQNYIEINWEKGERRQEVSLS